MSAIPLNSEDFATLAGAIDSGIRRCCYVHGRESITFNDYTRVVRDRRLDEAPTQQEGTPA